MQPEPLVSSVWSLPRWSAGRTITVRSPNWSVRWPESSTGRRFTCPTINRAMCCVPLE